MKVLIRTDASRLTGLGHLARCLTLASALRERSVDVLFACRDQAQEMTDKVISSGFELRLLPLIESADWRPTDEYERWLGVTEAVDADQTCQLLDQYRPDWVIVDHYALGRAWESQVRDTGVRLFAIDDLLGRRHNADVILDQSFLRLSEDEAPHPINSDCLTLLGPKYALLDPSYLIHRAAHQHIDVVRRIFVFAGGADTQGLTLCALEALQTTELHQVDIDLVVGQLNPHRSDIERTQNHIPWLTVHSVQPTLAPLMARADLAVGAAGATTWERLCLGLPSIAVALAPNQSAIGQRAAKYGVLDYLGPIEEVDYLRLRRTILDLVRDHERRARYRTLGAALVDGHGVERVVEVLLKK